MKEKIKILFLSFCTTIVLIMDLNISTNEELKASQFRIFKLVTGSTGNSFYAVLLIALLCLFYRYSLPKYQSIISDLRSKICCRLLAFFFSLCMVFGFSFETLNSWELVFAFDNPIQMTKIFLAIICYYILFVFLISDLYYYMDLWNRKPITKYEEIPLDIQKKKITWNSLKISFIRIFHRKPFQTAFLFYTIILFPAMIAAFPATMMYDTCDEVMQAFGLKGNITGYLNFINDEVFLNNHHPICYTLFLKAGLWLIHSITGSYNWGLFFCMLIQSLILIFALSFTIKVLVELGVPIKLCSLLMLITVLNSRFLTYAVELTKDVPYVSFLLVFLMCVIQFFAGKETKHTYILGCLSAILMTLMRNDGIYIIVCTLVVMIILQKNFRKLGITMAVLVVGTNILLHSVLMPALSVTPTSRREALSLPFQQTARYINEYGNEVTKEEKAVISQILDYKTISTDFTADDADPVKNTFNEDATSQDMKKYFQIWFQMLQKHPGVYVEEVLNMAYGYFYPLTNHSFYEDSSNSVLILTGLNEKLTDNNIKNDFHSPGSLWYIRFGYEELRETLTAMPITSMLQCSATFGWMFLLWLFYCIRTKRRKSIMMLFPELLILMVCLISPITGWYFRYIFPVAVTLPFVMTACFFCDKPDTLSIETLNEEAVDSQC